MVQLSKQSEVRPDITKTRLNSLTGMRMLAAIGVFAFHALCTTVFASKDWQMMPVRGRYADLFWQGNWASVSFFFLLSGFVLTWSMRPGDTTTTFWRRRIFKIWPNHLLTFVAAVILFVGVSKMAFDLKAAVLNATLLHSFFPQLEIWTSFNSVSWSLSNEAFFYFLFPFLIRYIGRIRPERLWLWAGVVVAAILAVPLIATLLPGGPYQPWTQSAHLQFWFTSKFPPVRLLEFVLGIILARIVITGRKIPLGLGGATALTVLAYVAGPHLPLTYPQVAATVIPLSLVILAAASDDVAGRKNWLGSRVMVWLGEVSFAFYMCHLLVLIYGPQLLGNRSYGTPVAIGVIALLFLTALGVAALMFHLVESPIMRRFATSRRRARLARNGAPPPPLPDLPLASTSSSPPAGNDDV